MGRRTYAPAYTHSPATQQMDVRHPIPFAIKLAASRRSEKTEKRIS